ncbi:MAG: NAD(P)/FAD-dependent oxidoreductase [Spirochaetota bacterium]
MSDPCIAALVVGGGPAGLFLSILLAGELRQAGLEASSARVVLLEKGPRPGRKLLASGGGQCNITNSGKVAEFLTRYGDKGRFLRKALYSFSNDDLVAWLSARGLDTVTEASGKVFPASRRATEVLGLLLGESSSAGVEIVAASRVSGIVRDGSGSFEVQADAVYRSPLVAIATGGFSYPGTGSEGEGYALAASLGHYIVPAKPALAAFKAGDFPLADLAGLSFEGRPFSLWRAGKKLRDCSGDLLITHEGLSGPGILDASRYMEEGDLVTVSFCGLSREACREAFASALTGAPRALVRNLLGDLGLPRRMADRFCALAEVDPATTASTLRREAREALVTQASSFPVTVTSLGSWDRAMVTAGGVDTSEVEPATMESKLVPGLYFAGELLDVDGDTGGFNLQAAFSTAATAARAMAARIKATQT